VSAPAVRVGPIGCGGPDQSAPLPEGVDPARETVITGRLLLGGVPVAGGYVRLLDCAGEFTAEVVTSPAGSYRFFAAPGSWRLRALSRHGTADANVSAGRGVTTVDLRID
jgi:hypothetical protein